MGEANTLNMLGSIISRKFHPAEAVEIFQEGEEIAIRAASYRSLTMIWTNLGWAYVQLGLYEQAEACLEKGLHLVAQVNDPTVSYVTLRNLSGVRRLTGQPDEAIELSQQALSKACQAVDKRAMAMTQVALGLAYLDAGKLPQAEEIFSEALASALKSDHAINKICARTGVAEVALAQNQVMRALAQTEKLLPLLEESPDLYLIAEHMGPHWTCYRVLKANEDPRADSLLQQTHDQLLGRAASISDQDLHASYLHNVAAHQRILDEYAKLHITSMS